MGERWREMSGDGREMERDGGRWAGDGGRWRLLPQRGDDAEGVVNEHGLLLDLRHVVVRLLLDHEQVGHALVEGARLQPWVAEAATAGGRGCDPMHPACDPTQPACEPREKAHRVLVDGEDVLSLQPRGGGGVAGGGWEEEGWVAGGG